MEVEKKNGGENLEAMIIFYLLMTLGTMYLLAKIGIKVIENMN